MANPSPNQTSHRDLWHIPACNLLALMLVIPQPTAAVTKVKLHGYITARVDEKTVAILDDRVELTSASHVIAQEASGEHPLATADLAQGMLIEAEGQWIDHHEFFAEKVTVDMKESEAEVHGGAYLQEEPGESVGIAKGEKTQLRADGYWL